MKASNNTKNGRGEEKIVFLGEHYTIGFFKTDFTHKFLDKHYRTAKGYDNKTIHFPEIEKFDIFNDLYRE